MSEELNVMEALDNIDLSTVETSFPLLASGLVTAQIQECAFRRDTEKKADAKPYLFVKYAITSPWKTCGHDNTAVKQLQPGERGMTITESIYYGTYTDDKTGEAKMFGVDRIALLRECVLGKATPGTKFNPNELLGQTITLKLKFDPAPKNKKTGEVYGPRTAVDGYVRKSA